MAEFCLDCLNKMNGRNDPKSKYIISKDLDLCEGCGEWKHVVITERGYQRGLGILDWLVEKLRP